MKNNKKSAIFTLIAILVLMIALVGATFAFFRAQQGGTSIHDVSVTSNTTDNLSFIIGNDITFTASEANFYQGGTNVSGSTSAQAVLTPNNNTNQATMNYYMYLNLTSNPTVYSTGNTNEDAELVLQLFDGSNQLVTLPGLGDQVALGNGYGYDITGKEGLIALLNNHEITANGSTTTENWSVVITLVNLNLDQNDNTNKTITGEIIMTKNSVTPIINPESNQQSSVYVYWTDGFRHTQDYTFDEIPELYYYHVDDLMDNFNEFDIIGDGYSISDFPFYIRTDMSTGSPNGHEVCIYDNNHEFCFGPGYWDTDVNTTLLKLEADMEDKLGKDLDCYSFADDINGTSGYLGCEVETSIMCSVEHGDNRVNSIYCQNSDMGYCGISENYGDPYAYCYYA